MITWIASVETVDAARVLERFTLSQELHGRFAPAWRIDRIGNVVRIGVADSDDLLPVAALRDILGCVEAVSAEVDFNLFWAFSSVAIGSAELSPLLRRWDETDEPPVLSIIALKLGNTRHFTQGLAPFAGHELAVRFVDPERARDAARSLVRLARHALMKGGIARNTTYQGVDGRALHLEWPTSEALPKMVTIVL
jgi:hypothetical protein